MHKTMASTAVALSAAVLSIGLAGAAHADIYGNDDPNDIDHGVDIENVSVKHGNENVHVVSDHTNLRRAPGTGAGGAVFFDTDSEDWGPEFVLVGGYFEGTDYVLLETEGFGRDTWGDPVENGDYIQKVNYRKDHVHNIVSRAALGDPEEVRIAIRVSGTRTDGTSNGLVDWLGKDRDFTLWVAAG